MGEAHGYFEKIYDETYQNLLKYIVLRCGRIDEVHDILQNVYAAFYRRVMNKGSADIQNPQAYLLRLAKHEIGRQYGIFAVHRKHVPVFSQDVEENFENLEHELSMESEDFTLILENSEAVERILQELQKEEIVWKIFVLYFLNEMKLEEIAQELEISVSGVKNKLYRTLKKLRAEYTGKEGMMR